MLLILSFLTGVLPAVALTAKIDEAYASAIKAVQKNLYEVKAVLEAKDSQLQTFITIVCIMSAVALCGTTTFVVWFFIDRKKKLG